MKAKRQEKIIEIIEEYDIETQDELAEKLQEAGFRTTQATISRDIREMKLTKLTFPDGKQKYIGACPRTDCSSGCRNRIGFGCQ